jgi:membrane protease YdiL (CAAX protease family)
MTRDKLIAVLELAVAAAIFVGVNVLHVIPVGETPWILLFGWVSLRLRRKGWRSVGLARPTSWARTILLAAAVAVTLQLLSIYVTEPLFSRITGQPLDLSKFESLVGNVRILLVYFVLVWTLAAFGEELVYRGYLLNRIADLGGGTKAAFVAGAVVMSVVFGFGHLGQGATGVADSMVSGLTFGMLYLFSGRNLWLPILAHGFTDTIALLLVFFDRVPQVYR